MRLVLVIAVLGFTTALAQVGDFVADDNGLQNLSIEDNFEVLLDDGNINENDEDAINQAALSIISTGRPNCLSRVNWGQRFRHNWYITRFWECNRWRTDLRSCAMPRLYQPSLERCVWAWNWRWEPIRRNDETTTTEGTTWPTTTVSETTTWRPQNPPQTTRV